MQMKPYIQNTLCKFPLIWNNNKSLADDLMMDWWDFQFKTDNSVYFIVQFLLEIVANLHFVGTDQAKIIYFMTLLDKGMLGQHKFPIMNTEGIFVVKTFIGLQMLCMVITDVQNF